MRTKRDQERHEDSIAARTDHAKLKLRRLQDVVKHFVEGLGTSETAKRMGLSRKTVWRYRVFLELDTGKAWRATGVRTGEHRTIAGMREMAS